MKQTNTESIVPRGTQNVYIQEKISELVKQAKRSHRLMMVVEDNAMLGAEAYDRGRRDSYMDAARRLKELVS